jgi:hypothetical protein
MADENLSRAVALKALAADVAARLQRGENPAAIRTELLADGIPPEVVDHVFTVCESTHPTTNRKRTLLAATLSAVLVIVLPFAGAVIGAWAGFWWTATPAPDPEGVERQGERVPDAAIENLVASTIVGFVGLAIGLGVGLAVALPAASALSAWSIRGSIADDRPPV